MLENASLGFQSLYQYSRFGEGGGPGFEWISIVRQLRPTYRSLRADIQHIFRPYLALHTSHAGQALSVIQVRLTFLAHIVKLFV